MNIISTSSAPVAIGPYSQAATCGDLIFTSGQIPLDPQTGTVVGDDITAQTTRALQNLRAVLDAAGCKSVLKTTCFLTDMAHFTAFNAVYETFFPNEKPARSCVAVAALPKGVLVEVEAVGER